MDKLNIQDLSKLKITTVKQWCVNFIYDGEQYFLHDDSDEDRCLGLYHKINCRNSERIWGIITLDYPMDYIRIRNNTKIKWNNYDSKVNIVYSQIDKEYFVLKLTYDGFINSCYDGECKKIKERNEQNKKKIKQLEEEIYKLRQENRKLEI